MWSRLRQQAVTKNWMRTSRIKCEMVGRQLSVRQNISVPFQDPTITYEEVTRAALTGRKAMWPDPRFPEDVFLAVVWGLQTELRATGRFSSGDVVPLLFGLGWREWWGLKPTYLIIFNHLYNFDQFCTWFLYILILHDDADIGSARWPVCRGQVPGPQHSGRITASIRTRCEARLEEIEKKADGPGELVPASKNHKQTSQIAWFSIGFPYVFHMFHAGKV